MIVKTETLKEIIKESIKEVLKEERLNLYDLLIPSVSKKELKEIEEKYGLPSSYNEDKFADITNWVMK